MKAIVSGLVILLSLWTHSAMAYIDPGSGSAIMSSIIGLFVALGLAIKTYWYKIKSLFSGRESIEDPEQEPGVEEKDLKP